jgi:hypothetical protein
MDLLNYAESIRNRNSGIAQALDNAELKTPTWKQQALEYVRTFPSNRFMTENVRHYAYCNGLPHPPSERAWGGVMVSACKEGLIERVGFASVSNPNAHMTPATVWGRKC